MNFKANDICSSFIYKTRQFVDFHVKFKNEIFTLLRFKLTNIGTFGTVTVTFLGSPTDISGT